MDLRRGGVYRDFRFVPSSFRFLAGVVIGVPLSGQWGGALRDLVTPCVFQVCEAISVSFVFI